MDNKLNPGKLLSSFENSTIGLALQNKISFSSFIKNLRPWFSEFANPATFSKPKLSEASKRAQQNLVYFFSNYISLAVIFLALAVLSQPSFLISLIILGAIWLYVYSVKSIVISGNEVTPFQKNMAMIAVTVLVTLVMAGGLVTYVVLLSGLASVVHSLFHDSPPEEHKLETDLSPSQIPV